MGAIVHFLDLIRIDAEEAEEAISLLEANELWKGGAYVCILTATSLRGHKVFFLELAGLWKHLSKGRVGVVPTVLNKSTLLTEEVCRNLPHVTLCLLGKFKGETRIDQHLITLANETVLGLQPHWWIEKLVLVCRFCNSRGIVGIVSRLGLNATKIPATRSGGNEPRTGGPGCRVPLLHQQDTA